MSDSPGAGVVSRIIRRDTMLALAGDAQPHMRVVQQRDQEALLPGGALKLFQDAVGLLLGETGTMPAPGSPDRHWGFRRMGYEHAATVICFARFMGVDPRPGQDVAELYRAALAELRETSVDGRALDPLAEVNATYRQIRGLRVNGESGEAYALATGRGRDFFEATGAETRWADVQFEIGACHLERGDPDAVFADLGEYAETYWTGPKARFYSTRHRYGFVLGLAEHARGRSRAAIRWLTGARDHLRGHRVDDTRHQLYELSLTLALAEVRAEAGADADATVALAEEALDIAERVQARWGVIARTPTPMAMAFRRVYGDVALLADRLDGRRAAALGLRVCLSAKQSGFATHLRAGEPLLPVSIRNLLHEAIATDTPEAAASPDPAAPSGPGAQPSLGAQPGPEAPAGLGDARDSPIGKVRERIEKWLGPMLADLILPSPRDVTQVQEKLGDRHALDFAGLPDTLDELNWFRTLSVPTGQVWFERFRPGAHFAGLLSEGDTRPMAERIRAGADWRELAREVLPDRLVELLRARDQAPIDLVISPHRTLSLLPWAALEIDDRGTRLMDRAVLGQTPVLTCLTGENPPVTTGPALIRLVQGKGADGVWTGAESRAWGLPPERLGRLLTVPDAATPQPLSAALSRAGGPWRFLHVAAHGAGSGLEQYLKLPDEVKLDGRLSAAEALALHWPESALMASCKIGLIQNVEYDELLGFVMAVLAGGGRCVVAATDNVSNLGAGRMAGKLVTLFRDGGRPLDRALREAQRALSGKHVTDDVTDWALFNAYVR